MKHIITNIAFILLSWNYSISQEQIKMGKTKHKGDFYAYWGWNWGNFTKQISPLKVQIMTFC